MRLNLSPQWCMILGLSLSIGACSPNAPSTNSSVNNTISNANQSTGSTFSRWWHMLTTTDNNKNVDTVSNVNEAHDWLNTAAKNSEETTTSLSSSNQNTDRRLVRVGQAVPDKVFMPTTQNDDIKTSVPVAAETITAPSGSASSKHSSNALWRFDAKQNAPVGPTPTPTTLPNEPPPSPSPTNNALTLATPEQIKYLGLMQIDGQRYGMVQVGTQVHRVGEKERIGQGQWRIHALSSEAMQLMINGKVVQYAQ